MCVDILVTLGYTVCMKLITMKQNTQAWRTWRGTGLGASEAPAYMGESPWTTPFELWLQKTGLMERPPANEFAVAAMKRGTNLEPKARKIAEQELGMEFPDVAAVHETHEFLRASFDGYNAENNIILEIKCPGKADMEKAAKGKIPEKYKAQVQMQLLISKANFCWYYSWDGSSDKGIAIKVLPDAEYQDKLLTTAIDFWHRVQNKILPDVSTDDISKIVNQQHEYLEKAAKLSEVLQLITKG